MVWYTWSVCKREREGVTERDDWSWFGSLGRFAKERERERGSKREEKEKIKGLAEI
jgi:hypothetical protein